MYVESSSVCREYRIFDSGFWSLVGDLPPRIVSCVFNTANYEDFVSVSVAAFNKALIFRIKNSGYGDTAAAKFTANDLPVLSARALLYMSLELCGRRNADEYCYIPDGVYGAIICIHNGSMVHSKYGKTRVPIPFPQ